jgi:hypothetical protein
MDVPCEAAVVEGQPVEGRSGFTECELRHAALSSSEAASGMIAQESRAQQVEQALLP